VDQTKDRISGLKDKTDILEQSYKERGKNKEVCTEHARTLGQY
jgi:hypothetical protein